jgi:hypothetical protein
MSRYRLASNLALAMMMIHSFIPADPPAEWEQSLVYLMKPTEADDEID